METPVRCMFIGMAKIKKSNNIKCWKGASGSLGRFDHLGNLLILWSDTDASQLLKSNDSPPLTEATPDPGSGIIVLLVISNT